MSKRKKVGRLSDGRMPWEPKAATLERRKGFAPLAGKSWDIISGDTDEGSLAKTKIEFRGRTWDLTLFLPSMASREPGLVNSLIGRSIPVNPDTYCLPFSLSQEKQEAAGLALVYPESQSIKLVFPVPQRGFPDNAACTQWVHKTLMPRIKQMIGERAECPNL
jgi:hypothetical protein